MTDGRPPGTIDFGHPDPESVPVRDAATVVLLRDGVDGIEAVMLLRNLRSDFVGGAYVFPGGAVDPDDGDHGGDRDDGAFRVAAIRESFEEAGLLLARLGGAPLTFDDPVVERRFVEHRRAVDHGEMSMTELCRAEGLELATDELRYLSRWVTPLGAPRRYDTRFYVTRAPAGQVALHDDREAVDHLWIRPQEALARHDAGAFQLILPTRRTLEELAHHATVDAVLAELDARDEPSAIAPTVVDRDGRMVVELPDGRGYDPLTNLPVAE